MTAGPIRQAGTAAAIGSAVAELAGRRYDPFLTSFYLDVDGRRYPGPSDLAPGIGHLFRTARAEAASRGAPAAEALEGDLQAIEAWLSRGLDRRRTRGVAVFSCAAEGVFVAVPLAVPVADRVGLDRAPQLRGLLLAEEELRPALVALVDRERSRIVQLEAGEVDDRPGPVDRTPHRVDTDVELGSFSRLHEAARRRHLRAVAEAIEEVLRVEPHACLLLGGPEAAALGVELGRAGAVSVTGELSVAVAAPAHQVESQARGLLAELDRSRRAAVVRELLDGVGFDACLGVGPTLEAVADGRVGTLVLRKDLELPGQRCRRCAALTRHRAVCPRCGGPLEAVAELAEATVAEVVGRGGAVELVDPPALAEHDGVGSLLRY